VDDERVEDHGPLDLKQPYPGEQEWSGKLPGWIWFLQLLLVAPIVIILVGQIGLLLTSALYQTPADGSSTLFIYLSFAVFTTLLLAPTGPFIHRFSYHVPTFVFLICVATIIYNLVAFPFSRQVLFLTFSAVCNASALRNVKLLFCDVFADSSAGNIA
jgi:hypothetical protein